MEKNKHDQQPNDVKARKPTIESSEKKTSMFGWITQIGHLRGLLLVIAGATYILGYLTWSFHAWKNGLGMLPALEAQYFVAGFIPLLILVLVSFAFWGTIRFRGWYRDWKSPVVLKWKGREWTLKGVIQGGFLLSAFLFPVLAILVERYDWLSFIFYGVWGFFGLVFILLSSSSRPEGGLSVGVKVMLLATWLYHWFGTLLFFFLLFMLGYLFYSETVYPNIPQEFGGVRPRSAYLDIVSNQTSTQTLLEIFPSDDTNANNQVLRSNMVDVYFSGRDVILVKLHGQSGRDTPTYEFKHSIVQAIMWCEPSPNAEEITASDQ